MSTGLLTVVHGFVIGYGWIACPDSNAEQCVCPPRANRCCISPVPAASTGSADELALEDQPDALARSADGGHVRIARRGGLRRAAPAPLDTTRTRRRQRQRYD
jgi:hypothetical protein